MSSHYPKLTNAILQSFIISIPTLATGLYQKNTLLSILIFHCLTLYEVNSGYIIVTPGAKYILPRYPQTSKYNLVW